MNLNGRWKLMGSNFVHSNKELAFEEVIIHFKDLTFIGVRSGFLKTSFQTKNRRLSSCQTFVWDFRRLTKTLTIQYLAGSKKESFQVKAINNHKIQLLAGEKILHFWKTS